MKIALTGATGHVGRAIAPVLRAAGHEVVTLGRRGADMAFELGTHPPSLRGFDALIHAGFSHVPGKYRGGEGNDPEGFRTLNEAGSITLFDQAHRDGVARLVFLSSRAVYGDYPAGTDLDETLPPRPDTLYGEVKWRVEQHLYGLGGAGLRATGVYAPGPGHKWAGLFDDYLSGRPVAPRCGTELHGADLGRAVLLLLSSGGVGAFNASDIVLDRADLLAEVQRLTGCPHPVPARATTPISAMTCDRLAALGWRPGGRALLRATLPQMLP